MLSNYFKIFTRTLKKQRIYSFVNILGLAVGITCFFTLSLFVLDELSFDKFNKNADNIYRLYIDQFINNTDGCSSKTPGILGTTLLQNFPEVTNYTRIGYYGNYLLRYEDKEFREGRIYAVDSSFFDVFTLPFLEGNPKTALTKPNALVITESAARRYFGDENPVGKILRKSKTYKPDYLSSELDGGQKFYNEENEDFLITGLMKDFPKNSHFSCDFLSSMSTYKVNEFWLDGWYSTYIVLKPGTNAEEFETKLQKVVIDNVGPVAERILGISLKDFLAAGNRYAYRLQPLTSIYLYSQRKYGIDQNTEWGDIRSSDIENVYIFSAVAIFILLIAVINFMNLTTARSEKRAKEVGIRKTLGSNKMTLVWQFISEAIQMTMFAMIISIVLLEIILPFFNNFSGRNLTMQFFDNFYTIPLIISFVLFVGILAGSYPAFYLTSFKPVQVLKSNLYNGSRKSYLRSTLVIAQFTISICLLIATIIIKNQLNYIQNKNLGFKKDHLVSIVNATVIGKNVETFKQELLKNLNIISVCSSSPMFRSGVHGNGYLYNKKTGSDPFGFQYVDTDYDFLKTFQIEMKEGRFFSKEFSTDSLAVVINEAAIREFQNGNITIEEADPIGKDLNRITREESTKTYKIIGIIKDFHYESLHQKIRPLALHLKRPDQTTNILNIRVNSNDMKNTMGYIEESWKKFVGNEGIYYRFMDETLSRLYEGEKRTETIATIFSFLAIFIASLGLFGLASFVTEQRIKEIGIRKVLGASIVEIVTLLSKEFTKWVLLANIIAWPAAYYFMSNWLEDFAYRINITPLVFIVSGGIALLIALVTVSFQAIKAAFANPVDSLKYE